MNNIPIRLGADKRVKDNGMNAYALSRTEVNYAMDDVSVHGGQQLTSAVEYMVRVEGIPSNVRNGESWLHDVWRDITYQITAVREDTNRRALHLTCVT